MLYKVDKPYPELKVEGKNFAYARAMLSNMGGRNSEMTAVGSYFYNVLATSGRADELSHIFHGISIVEMQHLQMFGALAKLLGGDPRLWEARQGGHRYWSPGYIDYRWGIPELIKSSINAEHAAIQKYRAQEQKISDPNIQALLSRIIEDEQLHIKIFEDQLAVFR